MSFSYRKIGWPERESIWSRLNKDLTDHFTYDVIMHHLVCDGTSVYGAFDFSGVMVGLLFGVDYKSFMYVMAISVEEKCRGQGIAKRLLSLFLQENSKENVGIWVKIHKENLPSIRLFQSFGFQKKPKKQYPLKKTYRDGYSPYLLKDEFLQK